jgi:peptidoglycan/LPS O-acetylase OafA/YrhL
VDASSLRALGVTTPNTPSWDREAQIALGCGLGVLAVLRRRWPAVLALGIGARIVLDPSVYTYYTAGFALGVLIWDLVGFRRPMPVLSALCFAGLIAPVFLLHNGHLLGELRLWTLLVAGAVLLVIPGRKEPI